MNAIKLKPEKELKTLWTIAWVVSLVLGIILLALLAIKAAPWIVGVSIAGWIIIMIPVIIWIPAAFRVLEYSIDDEGVKMRGGVVWKKQVTVPYSKITNVDITQGPLQRYYNIGTIHVQTAGAGGKQGEKAELKVNGIRKLEEVRDIIIRKVKDSTYLAAGEVKSQEETLSAGKTSVFNDMLEELKEIKRLLKKD
ncbi:MAG: PH domain-containing protein [Actinomycetota bacterium]